MTDLEFGQTFRRLERLYVRDGVELEPMLRQEYFAAVKFFPAWMLERAVDLIRDTHRLKTVPTPAEIRDAMEEVNRQTPRATAEDLATRCPKCEGDGWTIDETGELGKRKTAGVARYCDCTAGRRKRGLHLSRGMGKRGPVSGRTRKKGEPEAVGKLVQEKEWRPYSDADEDAPVGG